MSDCLSAWFGPAGRGLSVRVKVVRSGTFHRNSYDRLEEWWSGILSLGWRIRGTLISSFGGGVWWGRNGQIGQVATSWRQIERREVVVTFGGQTGIRPYR